MIVERENAGCDANSNFLTQASLATQLSQESQYICFPPPEISRFSKEAVAPRTDIDLWLYRYLTNSPGVLDQINKIKTLPHDVQLALARLVIMLLSGEESAVHVFYREGHRIDQASTLAGDRIFYRIAHEEEQHEKLLKFLHMHLPEPDDFNRLRAKTRKFFIRLGGSEPATQFARIASLDACVCKIMSSILNKNSKVAKVELLERIAKKIRHDEAGHVKVSRKYIADLGVSDREFCEVDTHVRSNIISLFEYAGSSFEVLGVDPDKLFKKILRGRDL